MRGIRLFRLAGFAKSSDSRAIKLRHCIALLVTLCAHFFVLTFISTKFVMPRNVPAGESIPATPVTIALIKQDTTTGASVVKPTASAPSKPGLAQKLGKELSEPEPMAAELPPPSDLMANGPPPIADILTPSTAYYFPTAELTERPLTSSDPAPEIALGFTANTSGLAILRLQINEQGEVDHVIVDESDFADAEQRLLVDAFAKMKFKPGHIAGTTVKSEMRIEVVVERIAPIAFPK